MHFSLSADEVERKNVQEVFAYNHGLDIEASFILRNEIIFSDMEIGRGFDGRMSLLIGKGFASFAVDVSKARFSGIVFIRYQEDAFFPYEISTVNSRWMYRMRMMQQARLNAKPSKLMIVYDLLLVRKRTAYINVFMFLVFLNYSLFTTSAGFSLAACHTRQLMLMMTTASSPTKTRRKDQMLMSIWRI